MSELYDHPFGINPVLDRMKEMGYGGIVIRPVPDFAEEKEFAQIDWYRIIGQKTE